MTIDLVKCFEDPKNQRKDFVTLYNSLINSSNLKYFLYRNVDPKCQNKEFIEKYSKKPKPKSMFKLVKFPGSLPYCVGN